ncbi:MAG: hypothetical protein IPG53_23540 [Ignavibacteriales bacterium]|nr:hypothetical protein [Ignavibacteriales bacterium]
MHVLKPKRDLVLDGNFLVSTDKETRRRYRIENDIPVMLVGESEVFVTRRVGRNNEKTRQMAVC